jgi:hypothetical protein
VIFSAKRNAARHAHALQQAETNQICLRPFLLPAVLLAVSWSAAGLAQKPVDRNSVAPEFRSAAEKHRAEQTKLLDRSKNGDRAKVLPRDRAMFVSGCLNE